MKRALPAVLLFVAVTLVLAWVWQEADLRITYARFLKTSGRPLLDAIGLDHVRIVGGRMRYINWIPFVGLMLATPGLALVRRGAGLGLGLVALYASHLLLNATQTRGAPQLPLVPSLVSDTLPFLLWLAAAHPVVRPWFASVLAVPGPAEDDFVATDSPSASSEPDATDERDDPSPPTEERTT